MTQSENQSIAPAIPDSATIRHRKKVRLYFWISMACSMTGPLCLLPIEHITPLPPGIGYSHIFSMLVLAGVLGFFCAISGMYHTLHSHTGMPRMWWLVFFLMDAGIFFYGTLQVTRPLWVLVNQITQTGAS